MRRWLLAWALVYSTSFGCASSPGLTLARAGRHDELKASLARARAAGKLDPARVRAIAVAVGTREIQITTPSGASALEQVGGCTRDFAEPLEARASREDEVGAAAALVLTDAHTDWRSPADLLRRYGTAADGRWRAVAARAAVGREMGPARRRFYADADERVRLAALRATLAGVDESDRGPLLEVARLDPQPLAQALAARALGQLADRNVVQDLRDLYTSADEDLRQSIVDAWGQKPAASAGGLSELVRVAETERGAPAIEAGRLLVQFQGDRAAVLAGTRALVRGIREGLARDRVLAITFAPIQDSAVVESVRKAAESTEVDVKVAALSRLLEDPASRMQALGRLRELARHGARTAEASLAEAGDLEAALFLEKELSVGDRAARLATMRELIRAGRRMSVVELLGDADGAIRIAASCALSSSE